MTSNKTKPNKPTETENAVPASEITSQKRITLQLICKRHNIGNDLTQEQRFERICGLTHVRLDRENLMEIDGLQFVTGCTALYLQHNIIREIANLEMLPRLTLLTLASNQITELRGVAHLKSLRMLDLHDNNISVINVAELPVTLFILNLLGNPCTQRNDYREKIISRLPCLRQLDGQMLSYEELCKYGHSPEVEDEEEEEDEEEKYCGSEKDHDTSRTTFLSSRAASDSSRSTSSSLHNILLRSQARMEELNIDHQEKLRELKEFGAKMHDAGNS